jgi:hypothetical protein
MQTAVLANRRDDTGRTLITEVQMKVSKDCLFASAALAVAMLFATQAVAQKKYDHGATDTEIKIGNIMPYSGPASSYATIGKTMSAYFDKINAEGGINGRKIRFVTQDDGYQPPKTVEVARKLVEQDEVLFLAGALGTPTNSAIQKYMNLKKVPHLFIASGATKWGDPKNFPWTMGWQPSYRRRNSRTLHGRDLSVRQDWHPLSERRFRQGLREGVQGECERRWNETDPSRDVV